ncbi:uncharacterized protein LOC109539949 [Dendroctonus ponderosae]|uniref:uncharacterized protein LOC109539949 n=1 Tax=Dendroctonus ponderosae TaxID=77166 RepID=UPI002034A82B|nr:uncharacterized protein LOC109539949 [Dendroctonus ponderosae]
MESYATVSNYKKKIRTVFISICLLGLVRKLRFKSVILNQLQIINWLWTVIWSYVDIFLISLFICFTYRLEQIENKIELMVSNKVEDISRWKEIREHFVKLTDLCFQIEHCISPLLLISFANKLYTVIYQLLGILSGSTYGIEYSTELINRFYYGFSFFYILLRLGGVIMFGSQIYTKNHDIAMKLFEAPGKIYNIEIDRFITHIIICPPAITGGKMFQLKKCLILKLLMHININDEMVSTNPEMTISKCLKKLLLLGQIFGFFPVQDINKPTQKFACKSFRMLYSVFSMCGSLFLCIMQLNKAVKQSIGIDQIDYIAKYVSSAYVAIVFIGLARQWPHLMAEWTRVEQKMHKYGFPKKLNKQVTIIISFFMTAFLVEYVLHQASRIDRVMECQSDKDRAIQFFFGNLTLSHVFQYIPYNIPTSLIFQYWVYQMEFGFTYTDIFVTVISMCLAERMRQVTKRVKLACAKEIADEQIWKEIRKDYTRLQSLIELVNDKISNIILISFLPNIFTILTQVYSTLKPKHNNTEAVYFYFSLIFLVSRTVTVCICGAKVNEESRRPLNILNSVPHTIYNDEIEIFISQISNFEIAMNGKHFFNIKKNVILELAGAIVTYELVLIQFNQESLNSWSRSTRCSFYVEIVAILQTFNFMHLTHSWKQIVYEWEVLEKSMMHYKGPYVNLEKTMKIIMGVLLLFLIVLNVFTFLGECVVLTKLYELYTPYGQQSFPATITSTVYYIGLAQREFIWVFKDILIIIVSICFTFRLRQLKERVFFIIQMRINNVEVWRATREDYAKLLSLCETINNKFCWLIVISYFQNIQYLLLGIFSAVVHHDNCPTSKQFTKEIQLYGISSMIIRLILVSFIGGSINSENENLIDLLTSVPSNMYNKEVERFLNHVASREMILTGGNYFKITRSLILQIANALVTYELVSIQFVQNFKHIE